MFPGSSYWGIGDKPGATTSGIQSAAGANCPASNRNRYSEWQDEKSWRYWDNEWQEDPTITVICSHHEKVHKPVILLTTENGDRLGQYSLSGEHNNSPYYVQTNTLSQSGSRPVYLYRSDNQWRVGSVLGKRGGWLYNPSDSVSVPETGWKVAVKSNRPDDPQLTARYGPLTECGDIKVTSNGPTANKRSDCLLFNKISSESLCVSIAGSLTTSYN